MWLFFLTAVFGAV